MWNKQGKIFKKPPANYKLVTPQIMLTTIAIVLIVLWALGLVTSTTMGGLVHVLLVIAVIMILIRLIQGRKVL